MNDEAIDNGDKLPMRMDKALQWLTISRDTWKEKCLSTKLKLKRQTFEVKRLKAKRRDWKLANIRLKYDLSNCKEELLSLQKLVKSLQSEIKDCKNEVQVVKKKR